MSNSIESEIICLIKKIFKKVLRVYSSVTNFQDQAWRSGSFQPCAGEILWRNCSQVQYFSLGE